jgi:glycosyltransferase involved in cell wall biosynthesis
MIDHATLKKRGVTLLASRICVLGYDPCGGSEVVLWEDARILENAGIPVRVYARAACKHAPVNIVPFRRRTAQLNTIEYARALLRNEPEALIIAYNEPALAGYAPDRSIVRFDWATPLPRYWNWPLWLSRFQRARYLVPSESEREIFLEQHARIPPGQVTVIPNAVDLELFQPSEHAHRQSNDHLRVGFAGQWSTGKGLQQLLDAWAELPCAFSFSKLYLAGGPALWKRDQEAPGTRGSEARVCQMAQKKLLCSVGTIPRSKMPQFWKSLDIAVVPSLSESFGLVALEALACGVPVIASAVGGLKEIIVHGECGLLVPPGDVRALAGALRQLLTNEPLRRRLAAGARLRAQQFSLECRSRDLLAFVLERAVKAA